MRRKESGIGKHKTTFIFQQIIHMTCMTIIKDGNQPSYYEPFTDREMRITLFLEITISAQQIFGFCKAVFLIMSSTPPRGVGRPKSMENAAEYRDLWHFSRQQQ